MATQRIIITTCDVCGDEIPDPSARGTVQLEVRVIGSRARARRLDLHTSCIAPALVPSAALEQRSNRLRVAT